MSLILLTGGKRTMKSNAIGRIVKERMGKETTTTYTITVKHKGPQQDFGRLFRQSGRVLNWNAKVEDSTCQATPPKTMYSDDQKITRNFIKQISEAAGLKCNSKGAIRHGEYNLSYSRRTRKNGTTVLSVGLCSVAVDITFDDGVDGLGVAEVFDFKTNPYPPTYAVGFNSLVPNRGTVPTPPKRVRGWNRRGSEPNAELEFRLADPNVKETLTALFKEWGFKHGTST